MSIGVGGLVGAWLFLSTGVGGEGTRTSEGDCVTKSTAVTMGSLVKSAAGREDCSPNKFRNREHGFQFRLAISFLQNVVSLVNMYLKDRNLPFGSK